MKGMSWEFIELIKNTYPAGTRVRQKYGKRTADLEGTVFAVDGIGQLQVK